MLAQINFSDASQTAINTICTITFSEVIEHGTRLSWRFYFKMLSVHSTKTIRTVILLIKLINN